jgi:hypothetical protein
VNTAFWTLMLATGLLWPARSISTFDGIPLDGGAEAVVVGVVLPALWWLDRSILERTAARLLIVALLGLKAGGSFLVQEGLCARFSTAPLTGAILTMPIDEPRGVLRSWDVRADWRSDAPACTAIFDRPYRSAAEFPAWFVNIIDHLRPGPRDVSLTVTGAITVPDHGTLALQTGEDMRVRGRIGGHDVAADAGRDIRVSLPPGTHDIEVHANLTGDRWRFVPEWNGASAWRETMLTVSAARTRAQRASRAVALLTTVVVVLLLGWWTCSAVSHVNAGPAALAWAAAASGAMAALVNTGRLERVSGLLLIGCAWIPVPTARRNLQSAFVLLGVPWLAYSVVRGAPLIGHVSTYSWDDWLAYQLAGARIYMHGFWLEGGSRTFDYQPFYRWISGALHVVFGDSSVGETFLDASCLLAGALLAFALVRPVGGYRAALLAGAGTVATFMLGTPWYFVGRGLSEIAAAGFAFSAAFALMHARRGRATIAALAGVFAVLTVYTRLNHLLFAVSLVALLLPLSTSMRWRALEHGVRSVRVAAAATYGGVFALGIALFATRTWWYTGVFSVLYGTSLKNNDTGLRLSTMMSMAPWRKVVHSLSALVWMNEPPRPDARALLVAGGVLVAVAALCQVPRLRDVPASIVIVIAGSTLSSFFAHAHGYPGRMSIHLVPFAVSAAVIAATRMVKPLSPRATAAGHDRTVGSRHGIPSALFLADRTARE